MLIHILISGGVSVNQAGDADAAHARADSAVILFLGSQAIQWFERGLACKDGP
jgi:hypothetical protein